MREVNFSIPSANKASVGITTALYDRRALDTTSTLPLINSLNNLAYLTTSSARIRDILTVDGGVERLVCILKEGRNSKDMMECWKWNLAFQCVVNIGVRGSESVRTRVVEADMVPVIATLLDNYVRVIDKCREKAELEYSKAARSHKKHHKSKKDRHDASAEYSERSRRQPPPPIEIPPTQSEALNNLPDESHSGLQALSSPPERTTFSLGHHHQRSLQGQPFGLPSRPHHNQPLATAVPIVDMTQDTPLRPVRDIDRLPSMIPGLQAEFTQPESPTTPNGIPQLPNIIHRGSPSRLHRRPAIRHQLSVSSQSDIIPVDEPIEQVAQMDTNTVGLDTDIAMQDMEGDELEGGGSPVRLEPPAPQATDVDTLDMARSALDSTVNTQAPAPLGMSPVPNMPMNAPLLQAQPGPYTRYLQGRGESSGVLTAMPSDGDVLMCLQLLAYVSKYCNLRTYFQQSHLVPRLKIPGSELALIDGEASSSMQVDENEDDMEEYLQPDDFNIFPLVEKFTVRHHSADMQYWARVVMRNLCRKDDSRGGIRQCAYYQCGKWEKYTREFAKCRRCRRTKYCSKDCQKSAWVYHRHWCVEAQS
ncbi:hypothetical protein BT63DRAFT_322296 [Microthyrium microscopicum]|uniref:MYND-type zinc finger protein samB n=1 Tax=Microthyrium microscopicum TaxID=703497 RepID=A0A6A6U6G4_9PEZI|nr:hypothetical protein BT63DRAFT_322296 [Microthyrium microscopicum]